jgi:hypothetical protein
MARMRHCMLFWRDEMEIMELLYINLSVQTQAHEVPVDSSVLSEFLLLL